MKKKPLALALAAVMLFGLALTGCKSEAPIPGDKVAEAIFDIMLKDDPSGAVELFGFASEDEARKEMGMDGSVYDAMAEELVAGFKQQGLPVSSQDAQVFMDAFLAMFKNVEMTAVVKESDEKEGTAVVTCTISTFDPNTLNDAMNGAMLELMNDPEIANSTDIEMLTGKMLTAIAGALASVEPSGETADFDVDFVLETMEVGGKDRKVWLPKDAAKFGELVSTTALGAF